MESEKFRAIQAMIGTYNHEIRNPLTIAQGNIPRNNLDERDQKRAEKLGKALKRIQEITQQIEKVSEGEIEVEYQDYDGEDGQILNLKKTG